MLSPSPMSLVLPSCPAVMLTSKQLSILGFSLHRPLYVSLNSLLRLAGISFKLLLMACARQAMEALIAPHQSCSDWI